MSCMMTILIWAGLVWLALAVPIALVVGGSVRQADEATSEPRCPDDTRELA
jgi:hypothetical protein